MGVVSQWVCGACVVWCSVECRAECVGAEVNDETNVSFYSDALACLMTTYTCLVD